MSQARAAFAAASFAHLHAAAGDAEGRALRLRLTDIDEDPEQPRHVFDEDGLQALAETIRTHGVIQPVVVRPPVAGRYRLVFGARRLRASRLAGVADIPVVIRPPESDTADPSDLAAQVIENQHRAGLTNTDLAAAIERLAAADCTNRQIAAICALKDYQVAAFRQACRFPSELAQRMNQADIRALYDLYRQWIRTPDAVLAALPETGTFLTVTEARRIVGAITGRPTGSLVLERPGSAVGSDRGHRLAGSPSQLQPQPQPQPRLDSASSSMTKARVPPLEGDSSVALTTSDGQIAPVFIVAGRDERAGRLVVERKAAAKGAVLVVYDTGIEEVEAAGLTILRVE